MVAKILGAQRDFSGGEIDPSLKRADDHPTRKTGLRQMSNFRILNSGGLQDRPGRSALFPAVATSRTEEILKPGGTQFRLAFGASSNGAIRIFNSAGTQVAVFGNDGSGNNLPWSIGTVNLIVYALIGSSVYLTYPGMRPQVLTWDGISSAGGWTIANYAELSYGGQKRTLFYRFAPKGMTIQVSALTGAVVVSASAPYFMPGHVGTRIRFINRQLLVTTVGAGPYPSATCGAIVEETLATYQNLGTSTDPTVVFSVGDVVRGSVTNSVGQVAGVQTGPNVVQVQLFSANLTTPDNFPTGPLGVLAGQTAGVFAFTTDDTLVGPGGSLKVGSVSSVGTLTTASTIWDEEVINPLHGYPASVFSDQFRLGFCDFPSIPSGIAWSAIDNPSDMYVGADPSNAMFELAPDNVRVFYVVAGAESSEFVFCDKKLYYIKIDAQNPLKPGSVGFQILSGDGCAQVLPRLAQEMLIYVNAGGNSIRAVEALGAYYRPFSVKNLTEFSSHLFNNIQALASPSADGTFNERYIYCLNGNGQIAVGKFSIKDGQLDGMVGWGPWPTVSSCLWVGALGSNVLFTSLYFGATICEYLDDSKYLDAGLFVNALPAPFTPPGGKGPLWWMPGNTVTLMDQATRPMGTYQIDANGFIVPQNNDGENLALASLIAGQPWSGTIEPFTPDANPGQSIGQRMFKRRVSRFKAHVASSTGFVLGRLFSGRQTPTSPPLGTLMNFRRFPAYNQGDDPTQPPPLRETAEDIRPIGRSYDARVALIKDTPGPLQVLELSIEATI